MSLRKGYSYATIQQNIAELVASGVDKQNASAAAFASARKSFFRKHPNGAIPTEIAYPRGFRLAIHYDRQGRPRYPQKSNPLNRKTIQAARLIESFSGHPAEIIGKIRVPNFPRQAIAIGHVLGIIYRTKRDGRVENYRHLFTRVASRPLLIATPDGKQLYLVGGRYSFTERGIENDSA